jgi:hypothetical protein
MENQKAYFTSFFPLSNIFWIQLGGQFTEQGFQNTLSVRVNIIQRPKQTH